MVICILAIYTYAVHDGTGETCRPLIGTFEESTSQATGCKAVPKGPSTKAQLAAIQEIERDMEATKMPLPV